MSVKEIEAELRIRDERDSQRAASPMKPAPDAHIIDTSNLTAEETKQAVMALIDAAILQDAAVDASGI